MDSIRVMVVEDSLVIRGLLVDVLESDPGLEVVGTANNGEEALRKIPDLDPDLLTLDIEMPVMGGLETLEFLRHRHRGLPVIMFSTLTQHGAEATLEALVRGASDYCFKPANVGSLTESIDRVRDELIPKIHALCPTVRKHRPTPQAAGSPLPATSSSKNHVELITISASTGGPKALEQVLSALDAEFPVPIAIVQHMPPLFTAHLASHLDRVTGFDVQVAKGREVFLPGRVFVSPGDRHLEIIRENGRLVTQLSDAPAVNSSRPSADVMLKSIASCCAPTSLNLVLTGMGCDGASGAAAVVRAGGRMVVQDRTTSVVWGMPGAIAEANLAYRILPLPVIPSFLSRLAEAYAR